MAPSRRKGGGKAAAIAAACRQWKVGDLVLAKVKGFPAWPAAVSEPEKWGYTTDWKKVLVHFFGTQQIAFCNPADVEAFTEEKKQSLLTKRHAKGSDFIRALKEIIESYEKLKQQVDDPKSAEEATLGDAGNTSLLPQVSENPTERSLDIQIKSDPSHGRDESSLLNEDASAAEQMLALRDNSAPHNKLCDSEVVKEEACAIATYSSRRKNGKARSQKCAPEKKICPVQRAKSSLRLQSDKHQSSMSQHINGGRNIDDMEMEDAKVIRRKRIRRSSGHSESDGVTSPALNSHGSAEENASEIATVESDSNTRNDGNGVDSGSKIERTDTGEFLERDYELNEGLNFRINTMVKRKRRKPTRKRAASEVDAPAKVEAEAVIEAGVRDDVQTSHNSDERFTERPCEGNGDEHLPLVKRARVRMSRAFYGDNDANGSLHIEERSSKDTLVSPTAQTSPSDIVSSHDTSAAGESKVFEVSATLPGDMVNQIPTPAETFAETHAPVKTHGETHAETHVETHAETPSETHMETRAKTPLETPAPTETRAEIPAVMHAETTGPAEIPVGMQAEAPVETYSEKPFNRVTPSEPCSQTLGDREYALGQSELIRAPDADAAHPQSNQVSSSSANEPQTTFAPAAVCSEDSQPMKLPNSEPDLPAVQCLHQISEIEPPLDPNTVDSSENMTSGICSSGIPQLSGQLQREEQGACDSFDIIRESLNELGDRNDVRVGQISEALERSPSSCLMVNKHESQESENMQKAEDMPLLKEDRRSTGEEYDSVKPTQSTPNPPTSATESAVIVDESEPSNEIQYSKSVDAVENCKQLETIWESDNQKQQVGTNNFVSESENLSREKMSLSPANIAEIPARGTPHSNSVYHISTAESGSDRQNNNSCSPTIQSDEKKTICDASIKEEEKIETGQGQKVVAADVPSTRESFEDALSSLVRTKESIGRATRLAMDLMKFGVSAKAMEILAHTLESESNLQRRVDLFFLVDSIAQCSKALKGDGGCVYLSAIQVILPRLLAAAVPAGATTQENRRQCLKVLRVWLERRILPESVVRHHIRELDSHTVAPACLYSRRSARTERSLDDPVRDMEGMLVDEYGSNSTLQLPGFCMPAMLNEEDEESNSDSDSDLGNFESVTPEHESRVLEENVTSSAAERHTLILEDVDGELEMEDVAPPWETGICAQSDQLGQQHHQHVSLSSPPLPSSTPPPPPAPPSQQAQCATSDSYSNGYDSNHHGDHQAGPPMMNLPPPGNTMHYQGLPESSYSSCAPHADDSSYQHRPYPSHPTHPHPPPPPPSQHQYSYTEPGHHMKSRRDGPSYSHRSHYPPSYDERNYHDNHERMRHAPYENRDNWRYPPSSSSYGSRYQEKHKSPYPPSSYSGGPPRESGRFQNNHRWNHPPRPYNNRHSFHQKPHSEGPPVGMRDAPGMWNHRGE